MKKLIIRLLIALAVLVVVAVVAVGLFLDSIVKRGVETVGPAVTKVDVKLQGASLSLFSGSGKLTGLVIGNPEGFKSPSAMRIGTASLALEPKSVFSDKVVIHSIDVQNPEITYETDLKTSNLNKLLANLEGTSTSSKAPAPQPAETKPAKKLQVDDFRISGAKLNVSLTALGGKSATVPLPEIHLSNLGQGPDGITAAELSKKVLQAVEKEAAAASTTAVADLSKQATELGKEASKAATGAAEKIGAGLGDLLKKK